MGSASRLGGRMERSRRGRIGRGFRAATFSWSCNSIRYEGRGFGQVRSGLGAALQIVLGARGSNYGIALMRGTDMAAE